MNSASTSSAAASTSSAVASTSSAVASTSSAAACSSNPSPIAGPSREAPATPTRRLVRRRLSSSAVAARAFAAKVTSRCAASASIPAASTSSDAASASSDAVTSPTATPSGSSKKKAGRRRKVLVKPQSRVARARIAFPDAKHTIVREAVMPELVPSKVYYHLMGKSFINLKDILNKTFSLKINSPSPIIPRKRRSSAAASAAKAFDKPSKKAKKIIV